ARRGERSSRLHRGGRRQRGRAHAGSRHRGRGCDRAAGGGGLDRRGGCRDGRRSLHRRGCGGCAGRHRRGRNGGRALHHNRRGGRVHRGRARPGDTDRETRRELQRGGRREGLGARGGGGVRVAGRQCGGDVVGGLDVGRLLQPGGRRPGDGVAGAVAGGDADLHARGGRRGDARRGDTRGGGGGGVGYGRGVVGGVPERRDQDRAVSEGLLGEIPARRLGLSG